MVFGHENPYYLGPWTLREKHLQALSPKIRLLGRLRSLHVTQRVQVSNTYVLGSWVIVIIVQVLGKRMIIRYLDP